MINQSSDDLSVAETCCIFYAVKRPDSLMRALWTSVLDLHADNTLE